MLFTGFERRSEEREVTAMRKGSSLPEPRPGKKSQKKAPFRKAKPFKPNKRTLEKYGQLFSFPNRCSACGQYYCATLRTPESELFCHDTGCKIIAKARNLESKIDISMNETIGLALWLMNACTVEQLRDLISAAKEKMGPQAD
jgi:hypothetical protein